MSKKLENLLYFRVSDSFGCLKLALETFAEFLKEETPAGSPLYYKARNYLRDGEKFHQEAFKEAKRLLGPLPPHATGDIERWRAEFLHQHKVLATSLDLEDLKKEVLGDEYLKQWMSKEHIERLLLKDFEAQRQGKRKLANIKVRILLERLSELLAEAQQLNKRAMDKFKTGA